MKKQPLLVHLIFHPRSGESRALARRVHRELNGDIIVPGLRVPTLFCPVTEPDRPPLKHRFDFAERNLVVMLADDSLTVDEAWCRFAGQIGTACQHPTARFVPFQLSENAWPLDEQLRELSFVKAHRQAAGETRDAFVIRRLVVELCRYLSDLAAVEDSRFEVPITLFLSHSKMDLEKEPRAAKALVDTLREDQPVEAWIDSGDIPAGSKFAEAIERGVRRTSLLAVLTDTYASREWCREEILLAKEHQRPVVVVDALTNYETRSFPYLGNVPRLRWDADPQKGIDLLLKETLRHLHASVLLEESKQPGDTVFTRPPELATLVGLAPGTTVLYPDPPVGIGESRRLSKARTPITTPFQRHSAEQSLQGKQIALSMSESTDLASHGMDAMHFEASMLDVSRYLLIKGATLVYGGHLGSEGYTQRLFEVVRTHNGLEGAKPFERIINHRGWPLPRLATKQLAELKPVAKTVELPRPADVDEHLHADFLPEPKFFPGDKSPEHRFAWARGMTEMRRFQSDQARSGVTARIVMGGTFGPTFKVAEDGTRKEQWYASRLPGVLEEILLATQARQPVYLIGAFGGVAKLVIDLLQGIDRPEATWAYQKDAPFAAEMKALYEHRGIAWMDYPQIVSWLRGEGRAFINPNLLAAERDELFETIDPHRMAELVLLGVSRA